MASKDAKDLRDKDGEKDKKRRRIIKMGEKSERAISPVVETRKVMIKADGKKAAVSVCGEHPKRIQILYWFEYKFNETTAQ